MTLKTSLREDDSLGRRCGTRTTTLLIIHAFTLRVGRTAQQNTGSCPSGPAYGFAKHPGQAPENFKQKRSKSTLHNDSVKNHAMFGWFCIFAPFPTLTTSLSWKHSSVPSMVKWSTARSCQLVHVFRLKTCNHSKKSSCCPHHGSTLQKSKTWATAWATWEMGILQLHHRYHRYRLHWNHRYRLHRLPQGVICPDESLGTSSIASGG